MANIYILEDSEIDRRLYRSLLESEHKLFLDDRVSGLLERVNQFKPDLIILDLNLPDGDGLTACNLISTDPVLSSIPVFIVSANNTTETRMMGLGVGANDFLVKPFDSQELRLKIQNKLRRNKAIQLNSKQIQSRNFELNLDEQRAVINISGQKNRLSLTGTEFRLLAYFLNNEEQVINRDRLLQNVWGADVHVTDRTVDTHVSALRKKCHPFGDCFQSVYGEGYRFSWPADSKKTAA